MLIDIITLFPSIFDSLTAGVVGTAIQENTVSLRTWNPRDYSDNGLGHIDDKPYGGGPGMVMCAPPLFKAIQAATSSIEEKSASKVIYLSPKGKSLTHKIIQKLASLQHMVLICGRYEGIDQRVIDSCVDEEYSIGDYVLSGGELPSMVLIDAVTRLLPGVLGNSASAKQDSFANGLLEHPQYTRPAEFQGMTVPEVLLSGDHQAIEHWRKQQSLRITQQRRPDLLNHAKSLEKDAKDQ